MDRGASRLSTRIVFVSSFFSHPRGEFRPSPRDSAGPTPDLSMNRFDERRMTAMKPLRPKLMVVDDEEEVLHSLYDLFRLDYQVMTFDSGREALKALAEPEAADVAVVISDQQMPEMSGVRFLSQAKEIRPDATRLLITGHADIKAVIDAINQGSVWHYIAKPWDSDELQIKVRQATEQHRLIVRNRQLLVDLERSNRLKSAFIEVASHELNTPTTVVLGMTSLWKMTQGDQASPKEREWVQRIESAAKRLAGTVERMVKLLHAEQFDNTLAFENVEIEPLIRDAIQELGPFIQARSQIVSLETPPDLGRAVWDAKKVTDILMNLIVNAIKFSPDGAEIRIAAEPRIKDGRDEVEIRVIDTGVGVETEARAHLFEPFFTGYDTMRHSSGEYQFCKRGVGLGLCLVKTFARLHGGDAEALHREESGQGTVFRVRLPRHPQPQPRSSAPHDNPSAKANGARDRQPLVKDESEPVSA